MFFSSDVVLAQFRKKADDTFNPVIRRTNHVKGLAQRASMSMVLERNGVSLAQLGNCLSETGFALCDAYVDLRETKGKEHQLLTFVFKKKCTPKKGLDAEFAACARMRYEHVRVSKRHGVGPRLLSIMAGTPAAEAIALKEVDDHNAAAYGMVVSKSVPKGQRELKTDDTSVRSPEPKPVLVVDDPRHSLRERFAASGLKVSCGK